MLSLSFNKPVDFHCHFRQDDLLPALVEASSKYFCRALAMPNTLPPIISQEDVIRYKGDLEKAAAGSIDFILTFKILEKTLPDSIIDLQKAGARAGKLYPGGVTTNSEDGVRNFKALYPLFDEMQRLGMVLCVHAEMPGSPEDQAEQDFIPVMQDIIKNFPKLRIVFEHVSTKAGVLFVKNMGIGATVTPHHLLLTHKDVFSKDQISQPHHYCKPVCKTSMDRQALWEVVTDSRNTQFFLGTDSAPHPLENKTRNNPAAGVFNSPTAIPLLFEAFYSAGKTHLFENFSSGLGLRFYEMEHPGAQLELVQEKWTVPPVIEIEKIHVSPLGANQWVSWK